MSHDARFHERVFPYTKNLNDGVDTIGDGERMVIYDSDDDARLFGSSMRARGGVQPAQHTGSQGLSSFDVASASTRELHNGEGEALQGQREAPQGNDVA